MKGQVLGLAFCYTRHLNRVHQYETVPNCSWGRSHLAFVFVFWFWFLLWRLTCCEIARSTQICLFPNLSFHLHPAQRWSRAFAGVRRFVERWESRRPALCLPGSLLLGLFVAALEGIRSILTYTFWLPGDFKESVCRLRWIAQLCFIVLLRLENFLIKTWDFYVFILLI